MLNVNHHDRHPRTPGITDLPAVTIDPSSRYDVDTNFECPLQGRTHYRVEEIEASAKNGCPICIIHHYAITQCCTPPLKSQDVVFPNHHSVFSEVVLDVGRVGDWAYRSIEFFPTDERYSEPHLQKLGLMNELYEYSCLFYGRKTMFPCQKRIPPGDTGSAESFDNVVRWLQKCDAEHGCRKSTSPKLPKRVLDVRSDKVRLHETEDEHAEYICLSHCWGAQGSTEILRTTWDNRAELKEAIPWLDLSTTFRDAITVVRRLGISFLWIDSLCILQDDPMDWQEQSAEMADIYKNAYITLAATNSPESSGGCFTKIGPTEHDAVKIPAVLRSSNGDEVPVYARVRFKHSNQQFPLLKRAWAYQERLLSPRVLHFAGHELIWECGENLDCECGSPFPSLDFFRPSIPTRSHDILAESPETSWNRIVEGFSCLNLTYQSDAFPALSGLAKTFAAALDDEYVAGLWRKRLLANLLWFRHGPPHRTFRADPWRAPTWSWVSTISDNEVRFLPITSELAEVEDVIVDTVGADDTGALEQSAFLFLKAKAFRTSVEILPPQAPEEPSSYLIRVFGKDFFGPCYEVGTPQGDLGLLDYNLSCRLRACSVYIVPIGKRILNDILGFESTHLTVSVEQELWRCLALTTTHEEDGFQVFERLGLLTIKAYEYPDNIWNKASDMSQEELDDAFERTAESNRKIFRAFEEQPLTQFLIT